MNFMETKFVDFKENWHTCKGENIVIIVFAPLWKGVYSKRKESAPLGERASKTRYSALGVMSEIEHKNRKKIANT